jgi:hypothetical protein
MIVFLFKMKVMWGRLMRLGSPGKLYFSVLLVPLFFIYIINGDLYKLTNNTLNENTEIKINEVCVHGLLYDARFIKKDKIKFLDSALIEVNEIENPKLKTIYYTNKTGAFFIKFPLNNTYQITFKKSGWLNKKIILNTYIKETNIKQYHLFIDAELYRDNTSFKYNEVEFPIVEIYYNESEKRFLTDNIEAYKFYKKLKKLHQKNKN